MAPGPGERSLPAAPRKSWYAPTRRPGQSCPNGKSMTSNGLEVTLFRIGSKALKPAFRNELGYFECCLRGREECYATTPTHLGRPATRSEDRSGYERCLVDQREGLLVVPKISTTLIRGNMTLARSKPSRSMDLGRSGLYRSPCWCITTA